MRVQNNFDFEDNVSHCLIRFLQDQNFQDLFPLLASNVAGYTKKTIVSSAFFISYCLDNIISLQAFLQSEAP